MKTLKEIYKNIPEVLVGEDYKQLYFDLESLIEQVYKDGCERMNDTTFFGTDKHYEQFWQENKHKFLGE